MLAVFGRHRPIALASVFRQTAVARLTALPGLGAWTAQYIALRGMREPDAVPADDAALMRALTEPGGRRPDAAWVQAHADCWRPWRAYAAKHLWTASPLRQQVT